MTGPRILVVEDDENLRRLIVRLLRGEGMEVDEAARGLEALAKIQQSPPNLLILDAMLPEVHGFDIARKVSSDRVVALSVTLFASVAVLLAALGLYGVLAYYVSRRTHEIGVRMALGAGARDVLMQVMKRGLLLVAAGIALGLVGAFWASRLLQQILFDIAPTDVVTFVAVSLFFASVALVACLIPALKALKVNPVSALAAQ